MDFRDTKEFLRDASKYIVVFVIVLLLFIFVVGLQQVVGPSMSPNYNEGEPHSTSMPEKVMTDWMVNMKTMVDKSTSHITELLIQGTNMGIIEGRRILNKKNLNEEVNDLVQKYVTMQEKYLDNLKEFL